MLVNFVLAFVVCGILCIIAQALVSLFSLKPPHILNIFLALGGLLTPFGIMTWLSDVGGGGFIAVICGAGNAYETSAELAVLGDPYMFIVVSIMFIITVVLGICFGELRYRMKSKAVSQDKDAEPKTQTHNINNDKVLETPSFSSKNNTALETQAHNIDDDIKDEKPLLYERKPAMHEA